MNQRPVVLVLELVLSVDPAGDADVRLPALRGNRVCLGNGDDRRGREQAPDPVGTAERSEDQTARDERAKTHGTDEQGSHGGMIARRACKGPKEPTRGVGVDAIAAVSLRSAPPG